MLKSFLLCITLLLPFTSLAQDLDKINSDGDLYWSVQTSWPIPVKSRAIVQSLDNKKVFILGTNAKVYIFTSDGKRLGVIPVDPNVAAIDIAPRGEMLYLVNNKTNTYTAIDVSFKQNIDISGAPIRGAADAPVTLVVFSDFECPWCSKLEPVLAELLAQNQETLRIVFKHLPLPMHPQAETAALAAIAAQQQGKFWEMHDALFQNTTWNRNTVDETALRIGLNMEQYRVAMSSPQTVEQLAKDKSDAQAAEVTATPSLFINGRPVRDRSLPNLQKMVAEALEASATK
ncbi:thioredoxin domain-containing protein [Desulfobulbus oligotrophicus]|uniref:Thioredoxin domain-containing protein n=1 Tax=Desulfobulbus oligotrophicus TaxID=1909699 RepID=A0A7T5VF40_9BACT|nr:thioredoxin domain-containing protein [Desulfobulbus oligotrophicus]QQG66763.1 thioredoxin domain-containing protein [Desulfobulbus oligotrophicus]